MVTQERTKESRRAQAAESKEVWSEVVEVNPALADTWLGQMVKKQRNLKTHRLEAYRRDMVAGRWHLSGQGILFNVEGELTDGQHRLVACIMAGVSFPSLVVHNVPKEAMPSIDRGAPRTLTDYLRWQDERDPVLLASVIRLSWIWDKGHLRNFEWSFNNPTIEESIDWLQQNPDLREGISPGIRLRRAPLFLQSSVSGAFWWKAHRSYPVEVERFCDALMAGTDLQPGNPILAYRRALANQQRAAGKTKGRDPRVSLAHLIKAFSAWYQGMQVSNLVWRSGSGEEFPELPEVNTD